MLVKERVNVNDWITYVPACTGVCVCVWTCVCKANKLTSDESVILHTPSYAELKKMLAKGNMNLKVVEKVWEKGFLSSEVKHNYE